MSTGIADGMEVPAGGSVADGLVGPTTPAEEEIPLAQVSPADDDEEGKFDLDSFMADLDQRAQLVVQAAAAEEQSPQEPVSLPGMQVVVQQLQTALQKGDVDPKSGLGQRFTAYLRANAEQRACYEALNGTQGSRVAKREFRIKWAKLELAERTVIKKTKREEMMEEAGENGIYLSLERIIALEGGASCPAALRRATAYCMEACRRGPPYVEWNEWKMHGSVVL